MIEMEESKRKAESRANALETEIGQLLQKFGLSENCWIRRLQRMLWANVSES